MTTYRTLALCVLCVSLMPLAARADCRDLLQQYNAHARQLDKEIAGDPGAQCKAMRLNNETVTQMLEIFRASAECNLKGGPSYDELQAMRTRMIKLTEDTCKNATEIARLLGVAAQAAVAVFEGVVRDPAKRNAYCERMKALAPVNSEGAPEATDVHKERLFAQDDRYAAALGSEFQEAWELRSSLAADSEGLKKYDDALEKLDASCKQ